LIANHHLNLGDAVFCVSRTSPTAVFGKLQNNGIELLNDTNIQWFFTRLDTFRETSKILEIIKPEKIYHLAGIHGPSGTIENITEDFANEMYRVHVILTQYFIDWCSQNPTTKLVVALSSKMFLPKNDLEIVDSLSEINPENYYGETKALAYEKVKLAQLGGLSIFAPILFPHTSPLSKEGFILPHLANQLLFAKNNSQSVIRLNNAYATVDISDARDICLAIIELSDLEFSTNSVIGSGSLLRIDSLINDAAASYHLESIEIESNRFSNEPSLIASKSEIKLTLPNWAGSRPILSTLIDIVNFKENGKLNII
jgi:GDP-D-mannose dehydratase